LQEKFFNIRQECIVNETGNTNEIGELNLAYLLLAQRLVREDAATAMFRLGMSRELADLLGNLSLSQIVKLSASSLLLCRFRFDDQPMLSALAGEGKTLSLQQAHAAILLSGQQVGATQ
jgi:flagellar transcriptional activator FlhD